MSTPTSLAAHDSVKPRKPRQWARIIHYLETDRLEATCEDVAAFLDMSPSSATARLSEMLKKGVIEDSGLRRKTKWGKEAICWRLKRA